MLNFLVANFPTQYAFFILVTADTNPLSQYMIGLLASSWYIEMPGVKIRVYIQDIGSAKSVLQAQISTSACVEKLYVAYISYFKLVVWL